MDHRIRKTTVLFDPFPEPNFTYPSSPKGNIPEAEIVEQRIADDEDIDPNEGKTKSAMKAQIREETARANAVGLTLMGDLPHVDAKPNDKTLFVCHLNRYTQDADLEVIFSRFGEIRRCNIVKDFRTGDSLQYAFIEFDERKSCEQAYHNMNGIIIDNRRIKVDFSQSVVSGTRNSRDRHSRDRRSRRRRRGRSRNRSRSRSRRR